MFKLIEGFQGHHRTFNQKNCKDQRGKMATNNEENANILHTHYHAVFNRRADIDYSILEEIKQHDNSPELGMAPTPNEILSALKCMKNNKAPSFSEGMTDMLKNLPADSILLLTDFIHEYWANPKTIYESWHKMKLSNLYKGKGDPQDQTTGEVSA